MKLEYSMKTMTIDTSNPGQLAAAIDTALRGDTRKVIFNGLAAQHEQCARNAGIIVEVQSSAKQ